MSNLFSRLGAVLRTALGGSPEPEDKLAVISQIEELRDSVRPLLEVLRSPDFTTDAAKTIKDPSKPLGKIYKSYFSELNSRSSTMERSQVLSAYITGLTTVLTDLESMLVHSSDLFGSPRDPDLSLADMRISGAAALGYVENAYNYVRWGTYMVILASSETAAPPYMMNWALTHATETATFVNATLGRLTPMVTSLLKMRSRGKDAALAVDGITLDQYTHESDYEPAVTSALNGFIRVPFVSAGQHRVVYLKERADSLKSIQNWLRIKVSMLQLQASKLPEDSPQRAKLIHIADNYMKQLTLTDKKLAAYD